MPDFGAVILFFLLYSFLGWIIDTGYRSLVAGRFAHGDGFPLPPFVPFAPIYGLGALLILAFRSMLSDLSMSLQFVTIAVTLTAFEYVSALVSEKLTGRRLWDYSHQRFHFQGRISLFNALVWGILGLTLLDLIHPFVESFITK